MFPYHDENEAQRTPYATYAIIALNVLAWIVFQGAGSTLALARSVCEYGLIAGELTGRLPPGTPFPMGEGLVCLTDPGRQVFNVLSSMFLHGSWMHLLGNMLWHSDSSFRAIPAKYSLLSARVVNPVGGNTEYADMRAAYEALDEATRVLIDDLVCEHSLMYSRGSLGMLDYSEEERAMFRPVRQRLVRRHPATGRKSLYLSSHAGAIVGMPMPEARILLRDLNEHAIQPRFVYVHTWRPWDFVMWDNRQVMHRVRRYDESQPRDMRRTTVAGDAPTTAQLA